MLIESDSDRYNILLLEIHDIGYSQKYGYILVTPLSYHVFRICFLKKSAWMAYVGGGTDKR
jgi:hypothetical protein